MVLDSESRTPMALPKVSRMEFWTVLRMASDSLIQHWAYCSGYCWAFDLVWQIQRVWRTVSGSV